MEVREVDARRALEGSGDIVVKVSAAAVNPLDVETVMEGYGQDLFSATGGDESGGLVLGREASGVVVAVRTPLTSLSRGDRVVCVVDPRRSGCFAEYVGVDTSAVALLPRRLSLREGAAYPYGALTASAALRQLNVHNVWGNRRVLVNGATGAVGMPLVQLLRAQNPAAIIDVTCSLRSVAALDAMKSGLGSIVDYKNNAEHCSDVGKGHYDVVFDTVGGRENEEMFCAATRSGGGQYVSLRGPLVESIDAYGIAAGAVRAAAVMGQRRRWARRTHGVALSYAWFAADAEALRRVSAMFESGALLPPVLEETAPGGGDGSGVDSVAAALQHYRTRTTTGKVVVNM